MGRPLTPDQTRFTTWMPKPKKRKREAQWGLLLSLFLLVYSVSIGIRHVFRYNGFKLDHQQVDKQVSLERQKHARYSQQLTAMQNPQYWELEAKKRLGFIKPGERLIKGIKE